MPLIQAEKSKTRKNASVSPGKCIGCNIGFAEGELHMLCSTCGKWIHRQCTKLSGDIFDQLAETELDFYCHKCDKDFHKVITRELTSKKSETVLSSDLKKIMLKLNKLDDIEKSINFMSEKFHEMESEIKSLKTELKSSTKSNNELKQEVCSLRTSVKYLQDELVSKKCFIRKINVCT